MYTIRDRHKLAYTQASESSKNIIFINKTYSTKTVHFVYYALSHGFWCVCVIKMHEALFGGVLLKMNNELNLTLVYFIAEIAFNRGL
ncbi:hypothetical protein XELAEV_18002886mg [Xenopus laevis]|nr:hypothetical protein XELAEV_18002886mg [Xenopus laevis]